MAMAWMRHQAMCAHASRAQDYKEKRKLTSKQISDSALCSVHTYRLKIGVSRYVCTKRRPDRRGSSALFGIWYLNRR